MACAGIAWADVVMLLAIVGVICGIAGAAIGKELS